MKKAKSLALMLLACFMLCGATIAPTVSVDAAVTRSRCCLGAAQTNEGLTDMYHKHYSSTGALTLIQGRKYKCHACGRVWIECTSCGAEL